jgi:hypothetical protein
VLGEGIAVWENAIARRVEDAVTLGIEHARTEGVVFTEITGEEKRRFSGLYLEHAEALAHSLDKYDIDGSSVYALARASVQEDGSVSCQEGND